MDIMLKRDIAVDTDFDGQISQVNIDIGYWVDIYSWKSFTLTQI